MQCRYELLVIQLLVKHVRCPKLYQRLGQVSKHEWKTLATVGEGFCHPPNQQSEITTISLTSVIRWTTFSVSNVSVDTTEVSGAQFHRLDVLAAAQITVSRQQRQKTATETKHTTHKQLRLTRLKHGIFVS